MVDENKDSNQGKMQGYSEEVREHCGNVKGISSRRRRWLYFLAAVGVLMGVLLRGPIVDFIKGYGDKHSPPKLNLPPEKRKTVGKHLDSADEQSLRAIDDNIAIFTTFFEDVKKETPSFAEDVLSWSSKWRLVSDKLPWTPSDQHKRYLEERFGSRLFTPDRLAKTVEDVVRNYIKSVDSIEDDTLVKIHADMKDICQGSSYHFPDKATLETAFRAAIEESTKKAKENLHGDVVREIASLIAGEVLTQVAVRMGVSSGIIGAGAGSSVATFGVGLVVGIIVDQIISWVWNWIDDPKVDLSKKMNEKLDQICKLIVDGDAGMIGLRAKLLEVHERRKTLRREAIDSFLEGKVQP